MLQKAAEAQRMYDEVIDRAEVEAETTRLRKRSQTQVDAEHELRAALELQKHREIARLTREHKEATQRLHQQHAASVAAVAAAVAALAPDQVAHAQQLEWAD